MAGNMKKNAKVDPSKVRVPTKNTINLAKVGEKKLNLKIAIPAIILILAAAVAFSKFLVIDRFDKLAQANAANAELQRQIDDGFKEIASFGELAELYAHYTYANMTEEELRRVDRVLVLKTIREKVMTSLDTTTWSVSGDKLTMTVVGDTLEQIDLVFRGMLEDSTLVDYYMVNTAATVTHKDYPTDRVTVNVTVSLTNPNT